MNVIRPDKFNQQKNPSPGKYDEELTTVLESCGAQQGVLIVVDGKDGPSFCVQLSEPMSKQLPTILRHIAAQIEIDLGDSRG